MCQALDSFVVSQLAPAALTPPALFSRHDASDQGNAGMVGSVPSHSASG